MGRSYTYLFTSEKYIQMDNKSVELLILVPLMKGAMANNC